MPKMINAGKRLEQKILQRYAHTVSEKGVDFIARWEGCVLRPYNDPYNATIGVGHLIHRGKVTSEDLKKYRHFSYADALELLHEDLRYAIASVNRIGVHLNSAQFDALTSFAFNCGGGSLMGSIRTYLQQKNSVMAMEILRMYVYANGTVLTGLVRRRNAESHLFLTGNYGF